ncbi:amidohydrolase family protein [Sulfobacillus harzensis]|uniref:Amidohydrolase family protein n=1 Tax=Sulfobacillus harzensis TaxID=2729629 RepID=A0A7Y0Q160_9FIRM|nr:amidohydrolase family protein [Sulfobacillus harzensis]NMP21768.1 amidohydrolase family protein [Sulfobacillus harzensis]
MSFHIFAPDAAVIDGAILSRPGILVGDDGIIHHVDSVEALTTEFPDALVERLDGELLVPGTANGHNHAFQILMRGMGEDSDFLTWRSQVLYPVSERLTPEDIYRSAKLAYWDMLRHGITAVVDFFYLNDQGSDNALAIARAAQEVGIRLILARTFYDWDGAPARYRETPHEAHDHTLDLDRRLRQEGLTPWVTLQVAPHSPHGASPAMVEAAVATAKELKTRLHIHVAEGRYELEKMKHETGLTPIQWCARYGALSPQSLAVHAVWVDDEDLDVLVETGATVVHNPASNMILGDGIAPLVEMLKRKIPVILGTDGGCTNDRHSIFDDMRMAALLQKVHWTDSSVIRAEQVFDLGTRAGYQKLGLRGGRLVSGEPFDAVSVRTDDPSLLPGPATLGHLVYAMADTAIKDVYVNGERVIQNGLPTRFNPTPLVSWARGWQAAR